MTIHFAYRLKTPDADGNTVVVLDAVDRSARETHGGTEARYTPDQVDTMEYHWRITSRGFEVPFPLTGETCTAHRAYPRW